MSDLVEAIFENGQFRPLEPVELHEHEHVRLNVIRAADSAPQQVAEQVTVLATQQHALDLLRSVVKSLPLSQGADGFSNRDHDSALYGWMK